jgi:hypothetical protein
VLIAIVPAVLAWLVAAMCILMGAAMLAFGPWMRRIGARMQDTQGFAP